MIDLTSDQKQFNVQSDRLKKEFAELFARKNDMLSYEENVLTALYLNTIGKKQYQLYCLGVEVSMMKQRIDMMQSYFNRNEYPDKAFIDKVIRKKFAEYQQKIDNEAKKLEVAMEYLKREFLSEEETKKIRNVYRLIVKKLHPDINPNVTTHEKDLFVKAQAAYELANLTVLNEILLSLSIAGKDVPADFAGIDKSGFIRQMEENITRLRDQIQKMELRFPFNLKENLSDKEWIAAEQKKLDVKIDILVKEKERKNEYLIMLGLWTPQSLN